MRSTTACDVDERQYGRSKFAKKNFEFWSPDKIGQNDAEMTPHVTVRCKVWSGERDCPRVLATRALSSLVLRYGRLKLVSRCVDFSPPDKIGRNDVGMTLHSDVRWTQGRR